VALEMEPGFALFVAGDWAALVAATSEIKALNCVNRQNIFLLAISVPAHAKSRYSPDQHR
jgi:hypothetical protein